MKEAKATKEKNIYVVLGMARSGTSAMTRGLQALGIDLGEKMIPTKEKWNKKGFWEDKDTFNINKAVIRALDGEQSIRPLDSKGERNEIIQKMKAAALKLMTNRFQDKSHWGFKDPRTAKVLGFWQVVFSELNLNEHYIIAVRNPLASVESYESLAGPAKETGLLMWLFHTVQAIDETAGKNRVIVNYDLLLEDPKSQLQRIHHQLNLKTVPSAEEIEFYVNKFLDKKLQHYRYTDAELAIHPIITVVPLALRVYQLLMRLAKDELTFTDEVFTSSWHDIKKELSTLYPLYGFIEMLLKNNKEYERKLRSIQKSFIWKIAYPLRLVDDSLRKIRKRNRERERLVRVYEQ